MTRTTTTSVEGVRHTGGPSAPTTADRVEDLVLVLILLTVAGFAGAASFTHVKDWTLDNSPAGTGQWFGWANAVISELVPIAALLTIRRRRRTGAPIGYPMALLVASAGLSLAAQLAVAKPGPSGWLLSAVPALAFMALAKLVLAPTTTPATPAAPARPAAELVDVPAPAAQERTPTTPPLAEVTPAPVPAHLMPIARFSVVNHEQMTGRPITTAELAARLSITRPEAAALLADITGTPPAALNGHQVSGGAR